MNDSPSSMAILEYESMEDFYPNSLHEENEMLQKELAESQARVRGLEHYGQMEGPLLIKMIQEKDAELAQVKAQLGAAEKCLEKARGMMGNSALTMGVHLAMDEIRTYFAQKEKK